MERSVNRNLVSFEKIVSASGALEIFGDDQEGRIALLGFLKEAAEGNIADPADFDIWINEGKKLLQEKC